MTEPVERMVEHTFRHEYGRTVAALVRVFGPARLASIEDAVQSALLTAVTSWGSRGVPDNPGAWLHTVARNRFIDGQRRCVREVGAEDGDAAALEGAAAPSEAGFGAEIDDDELRMLFVCCDEALPVQAQLVLALKTLCGFSTRELALRLLTSEANVQKRLSRGRQRLRERWGSAGAHVASGGMETPPAEALRARLPAVQRCLYVLFTSGYSAAVQDQPIRRELCDEALRLTRRLVAHAAGDVPSSWALLALMLMHRARLDARQDHAGGLLMLEEQDRGLWDRAMIAEGMVCLHRSGQGDTFTQYHAEAGVVAEHCMASSYEATRWDRIVELYALMERQQPSVLHTLNRAIALAEWKGPDAALEVLRALTPPVWLARYYLWGATLGELYRRAGRADEARGCLQRAHDGAPTDAERHIFARRLAALDHTGVDRDDNTPEGA